MYYTRIASRVFDSPLMLSESQAEVIAKVLRPHLLEGKLVLPVQGQYPDPSEPEDDREMPDTAKKCYTITPEGIAVIPICGTLVRKSDWMQALCGMTSYEKIAEDVTDAATDPMVRGIVLDIDSGGGEVSGLFDLLDILTEAGRLKPMWAVANDDCFSAAYAIASCAERIFVTRTGGVGSVGVIAMHLDVSAADQMEGLKYTVLTAGKFKAEFNAHEPLSAHATQTLQAELDRLYELFVGAVALHRGMTADAVRGTEAQLYFGPNGLGAGLADEVGTLPDAISSLAARLDNARRALGGAPLTGSRGQRVASAEQEPLLSAEMMDEMREQSRRGTAALSTSREEATMSAETEDAAASAAAEPQASASGENDREVIVLFAQGRKEGIKYVSDVNELCALAGLPGAAGGFIQKGLSLDDVRAALLEKKAAQSDAQTVTAHLDLGQRGQAESSQSGINVSAIYKQLSAKMGPLAAR